MESFSNRKIYINSNYNRIMKAFPKVLFIIFILLKVCAVQTEEVPAIYYGQKGHPGADT
jgi:hypothetical protein